jgi:hypothetical protein
MRIFGLVLALIVLNGGISTTLGTSENNIWTVADNSTENSREVSLMHRDCGLLWWLCDGLLTV